MSVDSATPPIRRREEPRPCYDVYAMLSDSQSALIGLTATPTRTIGLANIIKGLDELMKDGGEPVGGRVFKPTEHAYKRAKQRVIDLHAVAGDELPSPTFIPDGEGGIDIEWVDDDDNEVMLSCRARPTQRDFIYRKFGDKRGTELDVTLASLLKHLGELDNA